jgi:hypothetical protein
MNLFRQPLSFGNSMPIEKIDTRYSASVMESCIISGVAWKRNLAPGFRSIACRAGIPVLLATVLWVPGAVAQPAVPAARTTVVVFADRPLPADRWPDLFAALRARLESGDPETQALDRDARFLRGDDSEPGFSVESSIVVYLHGDCSLSPMERRTAYAVPLGWVRRIDGEIQPFVHVDCTRIGQVIGAQARWLSKQGRDKAMDGALARVILHEWIHIATQSSAHASNGIARAQFGVADLMGDQHAVSLPRAGQ